MTSRGAETCRYLVGYALALLLTGVAFALVRWRGWPPTLTFAGVLALALAQLVVQFCCFLGIGLRRSQRPDLLLVLFASLVAMLMVGGTVVILFNLRMRMM